MMLCSTRATLAQGADTGSAGTRRRSYVLPDDESAAAAASAQKRWPATAETYELHTVLEAAIAASTQQPSVIVRSKW
jgi:hypothetical protein